MQRLARIGSLVAGGMERRLERLSGGPALGEVLLPRALLEFLHSDDFIEV